MCLKHNMGGTQMSFFVFFPIFAKFVFCVVFFAILLSMFFFSPGIWIWPSKKSDSGPHFSLGQTLVDFCCFWILPYKKILKKLSFSKILSFLKLFKKTISRVEISEHFFMLLVSNS